VIGPVEMVGKVDDAGMVTSLNDITKLIFNISLVTALMKDGDLGYFVDYCRLVP
jgi:hypothetical protein